MLLDKGANIDLQSKVNQSLMACTSDESWFKRARHHICIVLLKCTFCQCCFVCLLLHVLTATTLLFSYPGCVWISATLYDVLRVYLLLLDMLLTYLVTAV
jgi:hypothetical protein